MRASARTVLDIIFSGHCTPVQRVEKGAVLAPARFHAHVEVEEDLAFEDLLLSLARLSADLLQHLAAGPDDDALLPLALHADSSVDAGDPRRLLPLIDGD